MVLVFFYEPYKRLFLYGNGCCKAGVISAPFCRTNYQLLHPRMLQSLFLHHHISENINPADLSDIVDFI